MLSIVDQNSEAYIPFQLSPDYYAFRSQILSVPFGQVQVNANVQIKWRTLVWFWVNLEIKYSLNGKHFLVFIIIYVFESYSTFSGFDLVQHAEQHTKSVDRKVQQQQMLWIPYYKCFRICFNSSPSWRSYSASFNKPKRWYCSLSYCQFKPSS